MRRAPWLSRCAWEGKWKRVFAAVPFEHRYQIRLLLVTDLRGCNEKWNT